MTKDGNEELELEQIEITKDWKIVGNGTVKDSAYEQIELKIEEG